MTASKPQQSPAAPLSVRIPEAVLLTGLGRSRRPELMKSGDIQFARVGGSTLIMVESLRSLSRPAEPEDRAGGAISQLHSRGRLTHVQPVARFGSLRAEDPHIVGRKGERPQGDPP